MFKKMILAMLVVGISAEMTDAAAAAYPFSDDFTSPAITSTKWAVLYGSTVTGVCANGVYTVTNPGAVGSAGFVYHSFTTPAETFTASCVIHRSADSIQAGMWLCMNIPTTSGVVSGYVVRLHKDGYLSIFKTSSSGGSVQIFFSDYSQRGLSDTLMVSKQGNLFNVFVNGIFIGKGYDTGTLLPGGEFGLVVSGKQSAVFDNVLFTNQYTPGNSATTFTDDFNDGAIKPNWIWGAGTVLSEKDGMLFLRFSDSTVDRSVKVVMDADTFSSRLVVSWRAGDSMPLYGFSFTEKNAVDSTRYAFFGISGKRFHASFRDNVSYSLKTSSEILGKAFILPGDTTYWRDTIEVLRHAGAGHYLMFVNGVRIDSLPVLGAGFRIVSAGVFCQGGQVVAADYFFIGPNFPTAVKGNYMPLRTVMLKKNGNYCFDPMGRRLGRLDMPDGRRAPGLYVQPNGERNLVLPKR